MRRLTEEQKTLAVDHFGMAKRIAGIASNSQPWHAEEIESAAMWGLALAARGYGPHVKEGFEPYAARSIRNAIVGYFQESKQKKRHPNASVVSLEMHCSLMRPTPALGPHEELVFREAFESMGGESACVGEVGPDKTAPACVECGDEKGSVESGDRRPFRARGMCRRCYSRVAMREYRKRKKAITTEDTQP